MDKTVLAYIAGFMDGEGCVGINKVKALKKWAYRVEVQITQVDKRPLTFIKNYFGGSLSLIKKSEKNPKYHDAWSLVWADKSAEALLRAIIPYLILKKDKALLVIKYRELGRLSNISNIGKMKNQTKNRTALLNQILIQNRRKIYEEFKALVEVKNDPDKFSGFPWCADIRHHWGKLA